MAGDATTPVELMTTKVIGGGFRAELCWPWFVLVLKGDFASDDGGNGCGAPAYQPDLVARVVDERHVPGRRREGGGLTVGGARCRLRGMRPLFVLYIRAVLSLEGDVRSASGGRRGGRSVTASGEVVLKGRISWATRETSRSRRFVRTQRRAHLVEPVELCNTSCLCSAASCSWRCGKVVAGRSAGRGRNDDWVGPVNHRLIPSQT